MNRNDETIVIYRVENPRACGWSFKMAEEPALELACKRAFIQGVSVTVWRHKFRKSSIDAQILVNLANHWLPNAGEVVFTAEPPLMPPTSAAAAPGREAEQSQYDGDPRPLPRATPCPVAHTQRSSALVVVESHESHRLARPKTGRDGSARLPWEALQVSLPHARNTRR